MKNIISQTLLAFIFLAMTFTSCRKDFEQEITTNETSDIPVVFVEAGVAGFIYDENNDPLSNATVHIGNALTTTNDYGFFTIRDIDMNANGTYVKVEKDGYFSSGRRVYPKAGNLEYIRIKMLTKTLAGTFSAANGGAVSLANGGYVSFPNSAIADYDGEVSVYAKWIDPTASDLAQRMPGNLEALDAQGEQMVLSSFGMIAVELESAQGETLTLSKEATLIFPVPSSLISTAPNTIPLWYFDQNTGLWIEEGFAGFDGTTYTANVSHFSFWNCDAPFPLIQLSGQLLSYNNAPMANVPIFFKAVVNGFNTNGSGYTSQRGFFSGKVPKNATLDIYVFDECGNQHFVQTVGPFSDDTDIGIINAPDWPGLSELTLTGTIVDCDEEPITEAIAIVEFDNARYTYYVTGSSAFEFTFFNCNAADAISIEVIDLNTFEKNDPITFDVPNPGTDVTLDVGQLAACGTQLGEYVIFTSPSGLNFTFFQPTFNISLDSNGTDSLLELSGYELGMGTSIFSLSIADWPSTTIGPVPAGKTSLNFVLSDQDFYNFWCVAPDCAYDNFEITQFGNVGGYLKGEISGNMDVEINQVSTNMDVNIVFKVEVE